MTNRQFIFEVSLRVFLAAAFFATMFHLHRRGNMLQQAAYFEGRYGLDHDTAVRLAASEVR